MQIHNENELSDLGGSAVTFDLVEDDLVHVLHPQQIIAYRGSSHLRHDKLMNIKGMYLAQADSGGFQRSMPLHSGSAPRLLLHNGAD